ncbi:hypothetical protein NIES2130_29145 [Scytonema sp. HK-05]|nr:hypothetical protein NIES2130_29145 [Scytonema sp. HK-05]
MFSGKTTNLAKILQITSFDKISIFIPVLIFACVYWKSSGKKYAVVSKLFIQLFSTNNAYFL